MHTSDRLSKQLTITSDLWFYSTCKIGLLQFCDSDEIS